MLAPFTTGWQCTNENPLVIEKSEVTFMCVKRMDNKTEDIVFSFYFVFGFHGDTGFLRI